MAVIRVFAHPGLARCAVGWVVLWAYVVAAVGVLPAPALVGRWLGRTMGTSERFPCENDGCGCATAAECWAHCCCHTEVERLTWAIEQGVSPPAGVEFTEEQWIQAAKRVRPDGAHCEVCVVGIRENLKRGVGIRPVRVAANAADECRAAERAACSDHSGHGCGTACGEKRCSTESEPGHARACISALECKGVKNLLVIVPLPARIAERVTLMRLPARVWRMEEAGEKPAWRALDVPAPPPRCAAKMC